MTEMVPSGLMRGHWRRSDGDTYTGTKPETAETAKVHLYTTAPVLHSTGGAVPVATRRELFSEAPSIPAAIAAHGQ
jgi:hypothetical protein